MRGWLHFWSFAVSIAAGATLIAVAAALVGARRGARHRRLQRHRSSALFGISALYHRRTWRTPRSRVVMKRLDHSMIFLFIAGTYTPVAALAMDPGTARWVLTVVWAGALAGVAAEDACGRTRPSWLAVPIYIALGWVAVFVLPDLLAQRRGRRAGAAARRRPALHRRAAYVRDPLAEPVAAHLRLPRVLPRGHGARRDLPPRRDLAGPAARVSRGRTATRVGSPPSGPLARSSSTFAMASRSSASHSSACWPTSRTAQASASERERATPASTSVSSTIRSGWRSRVITGTEATVNSSLGVADPRTPRHLAP